MAGGRHLQRMDGRGAREGGEEERRVKGME